MIENDASKIECANELRTSIVPVIDISDQRVVQARGVADRSRYQPIRSQLVDSVVPAIVARALVESTCCRFLYVADLNGLRDGIPDFRTLRSLDVLNVELWIDVGLRGASDAEAMARAMQGINYRPVLATESLESLTRLPDVIREFRRVATGPAIGSLDLVRGKFQSRDDRFRSKSIVGACREFVAAGVDSMIVLDVADVASAGGCSAAGTCRELNRVFPDLRLITGGGVGSMADVQSLFAAGCGHVLIASALHDGRISLA